ncbi:MAG TPA: glycosyltransferase family 4 protein [Chthonomonadaceae bacterium]|nr:glycosyltransferase family 4 protein [Chthonomonadaceae bacterium]
MIRVAQVVRPAAGGIRRHVGLLLAHLDRSKIEAALFAPANFSLDPPAAGVPRVPLDIAPALSPLRDIRAILRLRSLLHGRFDLVHAHGVRGAIVGVAAARLARIPSVFTAHNLLPSSGAATLSALRALVRGAQVVAVSQAVADSLAPLHIPADRVHVTPNGIDLAGFDGPAITGEERRRVLRCLASAASSGAGPAAKRAPNHWRQPDRGAAPGASEESSAGRDVGASAAAVGTGHGAPDSVCSEADSTGGTEPFVIAAVGRLSPEKGFDILVGAFASWQAAEPGTAASRRLVIAGAGPEADRLAAMARGVPGVSLPGAIADVAPLLRAADVVAVPSRSEGHGLVALEAMAARRAVVAAASGGLVETVIEGETGLLVPTGDVEALRAALMRLAASPELRSGMGARGRARVERDYSAAAMAKRIAAIYRAAAGTGGADAD